MASRRFAYNQRQTSQAESRVRIQSGERPLASPRSFPFALRELNSPIPVRHLDWNPDIGAARKLGVDIRYASAANEIYSPQLNISSGTVHERGLMAGGMVGHSGGSPDTGSSGGNAGGTSGANSGGIAVSTTAASAPPPSSGSSGHIK